MARSVTPLLAMGTRPRLDYAAYVAFPATMPIGVAGFQLDLDPTEFADPANWIELAILSSADDGLTWQEHCSARRVGGTPPTDRRTGQPIWHLMLAVIADGQHHIFEGRKLRITITQSGPLRYAVSLFRDDNLTVAG